MTDDKKTKRAAPISYRPPESLREEFMHRVQTSGLSTSAFITKAVFDTAIPRQARKPPLEKKLLAKLLSEAAKINGNLQNVSLIDHEETQLQIAEAREELMIIRTALLKAMGRSS